MNKDSNKKYQIRHLPFANEEVRLSFLVSNCQAFATSNEVREGDYAFYPTVNNEYLFGKILVVGLNGHPHRGVFRTLITGKAMEINILNAFYIVAPLPLTDHNVYSQCQNVIGYTVAGRQRGFADHYPVHRRFIVTKSVR